MTGDTDSGPAQATAGWRGVLLLLVLGGGLAFGLAELTLRLVAPQNLEPHPPHLYRADPEIGFTLTPGLVGRSHSPEWDVAIRTNALGLRAEELPAKPAGERRLLILGDSFTFGLGVEQDEAFPRRVERLLASDASPRVRVVNAGVPGYGTRHELAWWKRIDAGVDPDAILLAFFLGNDFYDNVGLNEFEIVSGYRVAKHLHGGRAQLSARLGLPVWLKVALRTHLHTYALAMNGWAALLAWGGWTDLEELYAIYQRDPSDDTRSAVEATRTALAELASRARAEGLPLGLVLISDARVGAAIEGRDDLDFARPGALVSDMATELGLPVLDLTPSFRDPSGLIHPVDGHWNAAGHERAAQAIREALRDGVLRPVGAAIGR